MIKPTLKYILSETVKLLNEAQYSQRALGYHQWFAEMYSKFSFFCYSVQQMKLKFSKLTFFCWALSGITQLQCTINN